MKTITDFLQRVNEEKNTSCFRSAVRVLYFRRAALVLFSSLLIKKAKRRYEDVSDAAGVKTGRDMKIHSQHGLLLVFFACGDFRVMCVWVLDNMIIDD